VKDILDIIIIALFVFMIFMFIKGFNKQQIEKHTKKLEENEKIKNSTKDKTDE
jgi:large-conductance mechanosensitive channel